MVERRPLRARFAMDESAKRWLFSTARKNHWRVRNWIDFDDLIQDGYLCWSVVRNRYPDAVDIRHIMSLFKTTYMNHIHLLARHKRDRPETATDEIDQIADRSCPESEMATFVAEAPKEVRAVLSTILSDPAVLARPARRYLGGRRETTNEWLSGITEERSDKDVSAMLLAYLSA